MSSIQPNPEIEVIVSEAVKSAKELNHEYVSLEHLLKATVTFKPFNDLLVAFGCDVDSMVDDIETYLQGQTYLVSQETAHEPKKTHALERVFNRALTQVLFTGRRLVTPIDLWLAIMNENNSHAHYYFLKFGLNKKEFVEFEKYHKNVYNIYFHVACGFVFMTFLFLLSNDFYSFERFYFV